MALDNLTMSGKLRMRVTGSSMIPAIYPGSMVSIRRSDCAVPNEIVLVRTADGVRLHRMVEQQGDQVITRGDALDVNDPPAALLGVLESVEPPPVLQRVRARVADLRRRFAA